MTYTNEEMWGEGDVDENGNVGRGDQEAGGDTGGEGEVGRETGRRIPRPAGN